MKLILNSILITVLLNQNLQKKVVNLKIIMNVEKEKFVYNFYPIFRQIESFKILNSAKKVT